MLRLSVGEGHIPKCSENCPVPFAAVTRMCIANNEKLVDLPG